MSKFNELHTFVFYIYTILYTFLRNRKFTVNNIIGGSTFHTSLADVQANIYIYTYICRHKHNRTTTYCCGYERTRLTGLTTISSNNKCPLWIKRVRRITVLLFVYVTTGFRIVYINLFSTENKFMKKCNSTQSAGGIYSSENHNTTY